MKLFEVLKLAGVTLWLGGACWMFQSYLPARSDAAKESVWRQRTDSVLARAIDAPPPARAVLLSAGGQLASRDLDFVKAEGSKVMIGTEGLASDVADTVDHTVRRVGLAHVAISLEDRRRLYRVVFELSRRGYDEAELLMLLGQSGATAFAQQANADGGC